MKRAVCSYELFDAPRVACDGVVESKRNRRSGLPKEATIVRLWWERSVADSWWRADYNSREKGVVDKVRYVRMRLIGLSLSVVGAASALAASSASAIPNPIPNPTTSFEIYENCPVNGASSAGIPTALCVVGATEVGAPGSAAGGSFTVGGITTPIEKQIVLQYGLAINEAPFVEEFVPPTHGVEAITPTPETVPGEPIGHITPAEQSELGWPHKLKTSYAAAQQAGLTKEVNETIELAGIPATNRANLLFQEGTAVEAPVKIKGENAWLSELGIKCIIGSNEHPIVQHLTSGASVSPLTGETILGVVGLVEFYHEFTGVYLTGSHLVDNTYAVPTATCTGGRHGAKKFIPALERTINKEFHLPQPAGASVTEIKGTLYNAVAEEVKNVLGL